MSGTQNRAPDRARIRDWLFALLRFAVTLDPDERMVALSLARCLDRSGPPTGFNFFVRTSVEVSAAIADRGAPQSDAVLRRHAARIDDARLARAFIAATELDCRPAVTRAACWKRPDLWRGLASRRESVR
jgi:hypothetical protein